MIAFVAITNQIPDIARASRLDSLVHATLTSVVRHDSEQPIAEQEIVRGKIASTGVGFETSVQPLIGFANRPSSRSAEPLCG